MPVPTKAEIQAELDEVKKSNASLREFCDEILDNANLLGADNAELADEVECLNFVIGETARMLNDLFNAADNSWYVPKSIRNALEPLRERYVRVDSEQELFDEFNKLADIEDTLPLPVVDRDE